MARKLVVGEVFEEVVALYREHAGLLLPVAFWLFLLGALVNGIAEENVGLVVVGLALDLVIGTLYAGMVVCLVREVSNDRPPPSVRAMFDAVLPILATLLGAALLAAVAAMIGIALLIVPGLFLLTIWAVIAPVIVIERCGAIQSLRRSRELVRGSGWQVFGALVLAIAIGLVVAILLLEVSGAIADGPIVRIVVSALASAITAPIQGLLVAVLYYRLLAIKGSAPVAPAESAATAPADQPPPPPPS